MQGAWPACPVVQGFSRKMYSSNRGKICLHCAQKALHKLSHQRSERLRTVLRPRLPLSVRLRAARDTNSSQAPSSRTPADNGSMAPTYNTLNLHRRRSISQLSTVVVNDANLLNDANAVVFCRRRTTLHSVQFAVCVKCTTNHYGENITLPRSHSQRTTLTRVYSSAEARKSNAGWPAVAGPCTHNSAA